MQRFGFQSIIKFETPLIQCWSPPFNIHLLLRFLESNSTVVFEATLILPFLSQVSNSMVTEQLKLKRTRITGQNLLRTFVANNISCQKCSHSSKPLSTNLPYKSLQNTESLPKLLNNLTESFHPKSQNSTLPTKMIYMN